MLLSIIIPIYNAEKYLEKCIESIVKQLDDTIQLILVDDGSKDASLEICKRYEKENVLVIHKSNGGLVSARKIGMSKASGTYVGFIDSDDWVSDNYIMSIKKIINIRSVDMIMFDYYTVNNNDKKRYTQSIRTGKYDRDSIEKEIIPRALYNNKGPFFTYGIAPAVWCKIFKRNILEAIIKNVDDELSIGEDAAITYPFIANCNSIYYYNTPLYYYRCGLPSMVNGYKKNYFAKVKKEEEFLSHNCGYLGDQIQYHTVYMLLKGIKELLRSEEDKVYIFNTLRVLSERIMDIQIETKTLKFNRLDKWIMWMLRKRKFKMLEFVVRYYQLRKEKSNEKERNL